jgi:hypothetical protein
MSTNMKNGLLAFTWINDLFPMAAGTSPDPWVPQLVSVVGLAVQAEYLGKEYSNTRDIYQGLWNKVDEKEVINNLKIYPNPAVNIANIEVGTTNPYTLSVTNLMGQVVYSVKGQGNTIINVNNFPAGIYIVNVKTAHASASQKLIVR